MNKKFVIQNKIAITSEAWCNPIESINGIVKEYLATEGIVHIKIRPPADNKRTTTGKRYYLVSGTFKRKEVQ